MASIRKPIVRVIDNTYIRKGKYFFAGIHDDDTDTAAVFKVLIKTPDSSSICSLIAKITATSAAKVSIVEGPTVTDAGSTMAEYNANRGSSTAATAVVTHTPTSTGGTTLTEYQIGAGEQFVFGSDNGMRLVLAKNTYYEVQVTAQSDNTKISVNLEWYED